MAWSISDEQLARWIEDLRRVLTRLKRVSVRPKVRTVALAVVLPLFGAALVLAWIRAEITISELAIGPMLGVALVVPFGVLTGTWQLRAMARAGGVAVRWWSALRVVTVGTLSSLLPVSSGTVIRGSAVVYWGVPARTAGIVVAFDAVLWISISLLYAGSAGFFLSTTAIATALTAGGLVLLPVVAILGRALPGEQGRLEIAGARMAGVGIQVARLAGCFLALGHPIRFAEASVLAAADPLASVFFFLPGGLGVREAFTSGVASAVGLSAATAFIAAVLNRLIGLSVLLVWELGLLAYPGLKSDTSEKR